MPDRTGTFEELMTQVAGPPGRFGHQEHVHLTYLAVRRFEIGRAHV